MSALASGVVLVTCWVGDRPWGMTVTAFASVSAEPPTVLVSLELGDGERARDHGDATASASASSAAEQLAVARHGSAPGAAKFLEPFVDARAGCSDEPRRSPARSPTSTASVAETVQVADHTSSSAAFAPSRSVHAAARRSSTTAAATGRSPSRRPRTPTDRKELRCLSS